MYIPKFRQSERQISLKTTNVLMRALKEKSDDLSSNQDSSSGNHEHVQTFVPIPPADFNIYFLSFLSTQVKTLKCLPEMSSGFIMWGTRMSVHNYISIHPIVVKIFQSQPTFINIRRAMLLACPSKPCLQKSQHLISTSGVTKCDSIHSG